MQSYINIKRAVHTMNTYVYQESQQPCKLHKYQTSSSYNEHLCVPRIPTTMQSYINIKRAVHTMNTYVYQESQQPCKVT